MFNAKKILSIVVCTALLSPDITLAANFNQKISGKGSAVIEGDVETTQTNAMNNAKKNLVLSAMNRLLGTQVSETDEMFSVQVPAILEQFDNFAEITGKTPTREGALLTISLSANLDESEFRSLLKDLGVGLNQKAREAGSIVIFFDETEKPYDQPQDMFNEYFEYNRDNSDIYKEKHSAKLASSASAASAYNDKSQGAYSNKTALSAKSTQAAGYSDKYAGSSKNSYTGSAGYSDRYGGSAYNNGSAQGSASVASSSQGYAKSSDSLKTATSTKAAYKNDVQQQASSKKAASSSSSSSVDDIHMDKEQVIYKKEYKEIKEAPVNSSYVKSQLQKVFKQYGLEFIDASGKLAEYNKVAKTKYASYSEIINSADSTKFKDFVRKTTNADYMGIAFSQINYAQKLDETTGKYGCTTTQSNVNIFSLKDSKSLDSGSLEAVKQSATSIEECKSNARFDMASSLGQAVGLGVQKTIRDATRSFASGPVTYKIIVQGAFNRQTRRVFEGIMENKKDLFKNFKMLTQDSQGIQYEVTYSGTKSVGDVLLDAATSQEFASINDIFNAYDLKVEGSNTVILYPTR